MRATAKAFMIANARGGNQGGGNRGGGSGGRSEMEMGGSEMRGGYQGGQNEGRNGGYGEMRGNYPRQEYGRSEGGEMRNEGYGRSEMRRGGGRSEMEMRRGGGRSEMRGEGGQNRIGYEGGGNARSEMEEMESRRRRDRRGRFRSEMEDEEMEQEMGMHYPMPFPPPIYEDEYKNPIGFSAEGGGAELHMIRGGASGGEKPLDKSTAEEWMEGLENEDGTKGPHWSMEQVKQLMAQKGWKEEPIRAWVALNIMYSDYCGVAKKVNANNIEFYVAMAKAFLEDKDAGAKDKLSAYYEHIVK